MFNYINSNKPAKKETSKTPIEMKVNMPIEMQPVPQTDPDTTCIYPNMNIQANPPTQGPMPYMYGNMCPYYMMGMHNQMLAQDPSCDMSKTQDDMEVAYIKKMYPPVCQKIQHYVDKEIRQYDHDLSPIYEMYPARETIDYMANCIYTNMKADMSNLIRQFQGDSFYTLIYVLLLNELYRKRMRRRLYR